MIFIKKFFEFTLHMITITSTELVAEFLGTGLRLFQLEEQCTKYVGAGFNYEREAYELNFSQLVGC